MYAKSNEFSFKKGQSGNMNGRPKKSTEQKLQDMLAKTSSKVIKAINKAVEQDEPWAIELCFKELAKKPDHELEIPTLN